jgi:lysophospholipid acyltransferase (LPLAT)-like uncharacterized protein
MLIDFLTSILAFFSRFLKLSANVEFLDNLDNFEKRHPAYIVALFHQNLMSTLIAFEDRNRSYAIMVSPSKDGEIIARQLRLFHHYTIRGSSSRDGARALKETVRLLKEGIPAALTVDGPRGPLYDVKEGIFQIARLANVPILPVCCFPTKRYEFHKAWDRFRLPLPFTSIICAVAEPMMVEQKDYDALAKELQSRLLDCERRVHERLNARLMRF